MVAVFNALLTSLDAKLPTSRFTADELRISNGRGRYGASAVANCIRRLAPARSSSPRPRCVRILLRMVGVNREFSASVRNEIFSCNVSHLVRYAWYLFPVGTALCRMVLLVFHSVIALFYRVLYCFLSINRANELHFDETETRHE